MVVADDLSAQWLGPKQPGGGIAGVWTGHKGRGLSQQSQGERGVVWAEIEELVGGVFEKSKLRSCVKVNFFGIAYR